MGFESRYYFKGIVYQGSTEQDAVASSLMAAVKKIFKMAAGLLVHLGFVLLSATFQAYFPELNVFSRL